MAKLLIQYPKTEEDTKWYKCEYHKSHMKVCKEICQANCKKPNITKRTEYWKRCKIYKENNND